MKNYQKKGNSKGGEERVKTEAKAWRVKKRETAKRVEKAKRGREHASEGRRMGIRARKVKQGRSYMKRREETSIIFCEN